MSAASEGPKRLFGLMTEFDDPNRLVEGCRRVRDAGYRQWDAHTPFPH